MWYSIRIISAPFSAGKIAWMDLRALGMREARRLPWRWLTPRDASQVKGMIARGDSLASIAKTMRVSRGRLMGIVSGDKFPDAPVSSQADLPPKA